MVSSRKKKKKHDRVWIKVLKGTWLKLEEGSKWSPQKGHWHEDLQEWESARRRGPGQIYWPKKQHEGRGGGTEPGPSGRPENPRWWGVREARCTQACAGLCSVYPAAACREAPCENPVPLWLARIRSPAWLPASLVGTLLNSENFSVLSLGCSQWHLPQRMELWVGGENVWDVPSTVLGSPWMGVSALVPNVPATLDLWPPK